MTREVLIHMIKEDLKVRKKSIAAKAMREIYRRSSISTRDRAFRACALCSKKVLRDGFACYLTEKNLGCFESLTGTDAWPE